MIKQVIVIRKDLKMRRGKEIAQGAHASMAFLTRRINQLGVLDAPLSPIVMEWLTYSFVKVCVRVNSEEELLHVYNEAKKHDIERHLITDNGTTEFGGIPTRTCLALGPDFSEKIDEVTGHLSLY